MIKTIPKRSTNCGPVLALLWIRENKNLQLADVTPAAVDMLLTSEIKQEAGSQPPHMYACGLHANAKTSQHQVQCCCSFAINRANRVDQGLSIYSAVRYGSDF